MAVSSDILRSYRAPRAVFRALRAGQRREARILVYLMIACGLIFVAQWPGVARQAHLDDTIPFEARMSGALFGAIFMAPLMFYFIGWVLGFALKLVDRRVDGFDARLALFWSLLAISPLMLLQGLIQAMLGAGAQATLSGVVIFGLFVMILIAGLRVALEAARAQA